MLVSVTAYCLRTLRSRRLLPRLQHCAPEWVSTIPWYNLSTGETEDLGFLACILFPLSFECQKGWLNCRCKEGNTEGKGGKRLQGKAAAAGKGWGGGPRRERGGLSVVAMPVGTWQLRPWHSWAWMTGVGMGRRVNWEQQLAGRWEAWVGRTLRTQFDIDTIQAGRERDRFLLKWCWLPDQQLTQVGMGQVPVAAKETCWSVLPSVRLRVPVCRRQGSPGLCPVLPGYLWVQRKVYLLERGRLFY